MNIKVEIYDTGDRYFDIRSPDIEILSLEALVINYSNKPFLESPEWLKFYNMIKDTYSGPYIEIYFYEEATVNNLIIKC